MNDKKVNLMRQDLYQNRYIYECAKKKKAEISKSEFFSEI